MAADDSAEPDDCATVQGSGCGLLVESPDKRTCGDDTAADSDSAAGQVQGSGCGGQAFGPGLVLLLVLALRRWPRLLALILVCVAGPARAGMDGQVVDVLDGGPYLALREADAGDPWSVAAAFSVNYVRNPVILVDEQGSLVMLTSARTQTLGASLRLGDLVRVGLAIPQHRQSVFLGDLDKKVLGDISAWVLVPIRDAPARGPSIAWIAQTDFATGDDSRYLGDASGGVHGTVAIGGGLGRLDGLANLGVRLAPAQQLPGIVWGNRLEFGVGLGLPVAGPVSLRGELSGSAGLTGQLGDPADLPVEATGSLELALPRDFAAHFGGGGGLTRGLGSPSLRLLVMVDYRPRLLEDRDKDRIADDRDRCPDDPEDRDDWQDSDGCPEADNDADRIVDREDHCPDVPETANGWQDEDGCPDALATLRVTVRSSAPAPLERASVAIDEGAPAAALGGEGLDLVVPTGPHTVRVAADGHLPRTLPVFIGSEAVQELVVVLEPGQAPAELAPAPPPSPVQLAGRQIQGLAQVGFGLNDATLDATDEAALVQIAAFLQQNPGIRLVRVEGHADESADSAYNLDLSRRRANAVRDRLIGLGVEAARLEAIGTGEAALLADPTASRRVSFLVLVWDDALYQPTR